MSSSAPVTRTTFYLLVFHLSIATLLAVDFSTYFDNQVYLDAGETYSLHWNLLNSTHIEIGIDSPSQGWTGLGLSPNGQMPNSDIAFFWIDDDTGSVYLQDRYTQTQRAAPVYDSHQNLVLLEGTQINGRSSVRYIRAINPCDAADAGAAVAEDRAFADGTSRMIYAWHDTDPTFNSQNNAADISFSYHALNRGSQSVNMLSGTGFDVDLSTADIIQYDLTIPSYNVPAVGTTYYSTYHSLPVVSGKTYHIVRFEPLITAGNEVYVHHMVLYKCLVAEDTSDASDCNAGVYAWAIGGNAFSFPADVGFKMSESDLHFVRLEIHFDNPLQLDTLYDTSGFRVFYTETLRTFDAGMLEIGLPLGSYQFIPPKLNWTMNSAVCMRACTDAGLPTAGVSVFASFLHAHNLGRALHLRHVRNGVELPAIDSNVAYDFDYQQMTSLYEHVQVLPGDEFILECYYDSAERTQITYGGTSTTDEMCQAYIYVYPEPELSVCLSAFTDAQITQWGAAAISHGYLTGDSVANYAYDSSLDGAEHFYSYTLWQSQQSIDRLQHCADINGGQILNGTETHPRPYNFTEYDSGANNGGDCVDVVDFVGVIAVASNGSSTTTTTSQTTADPEESKGYLLCASRQIRHLLVSFVVGSLLCF